MMYMSMRWHEILKSECILQMEVFILWENNKDQLRTFIHLFKESLCSTEYEEYLEMENYKKIGILPLMALPLLNIPTMTWIRRNHYPQ